MLIALLTLLAPTPAAVAPPPRQVGELIELKTDTGTLYGTLDLPTKPGPWPVVLIHAGSGPTDRDGNGPLIGTNCLKMIGRGFAAEGIAALRIDKRGIAASAKAMKHEEDVRIDTYVADVIAWVKVLGKDSRFTKIGFIGHSEGSLIGQIAANNTKFDAFVSLCGPGRSLQEVLREQLKKNLSADLYKKSDAIMTELEVGHTVKDTPKELASLFRLSVQPFLISVFKYDPAKLAAEMKIPFLIVSGSTDIQVAAVDAKRLSDANPKAKLVTIEGMNHVLKAEPKSDRISQLPSYLNPSLPLHPKLMPKLLDFFKKSFSGN